MRYVIYLKTRVLATNRVIRFHLALPFVNCYVGGNQKAEKMTVVYLCVFFLHSCECQLLIYVHDFEMCYVSCKEFFSVWV